MPYGGKVVDTETPIATLIEALKQSGSAFMEPMGGEAPVPQNIDGTGSLYAINQALYFCAPRVVPDAETPKPTEARAD